MVTTIIVGNGVGMSLDEKHFLLETGINEAIKKIDKKDLELIQLGQKDIPQSESELEDHHLILNACQTLVNYKNNKLEWLSEDGNKFPNLYLNFIYQVSKHFFDYNKKDLPEKFIKSLSDYIRSCDVCHIATLNYDKLLYNSLINSEILAGYQNNGLVDGIHKNTSGFNPEHLRRTRYKFGWYLHLHGSPMFKTLNEKITKCKIDNLPKNAQSEDSATHNHIVLAHTKLKPAIISKSRLLGSYFDFFVKALAESNTVYLFGYSGLDDHVNFEIIEWISSKKEYKLFIVEWKNPKNDENYEKRKKFWEEKLYIKNDKKFDLIRLDNILEYPFDSDNKKS